MNSKRHPFQTGSLLKSKYVSHTSYFHGKTIQTLFWQTSSSRMTKRKSSEIDSESWEIDLKSEVYVKIIINLYYISIKIIPPFVKLTFKNICHSYLVLLLTYHTLATSWIHTAHWEEELSTTKAELK